MQVQTVRISNEDLQRGVAASLYGTSRVRQGAVVWSDGGSELAVYPSTCAVRLGAGWMVVAVDAETDQTGRVTLQLVFAIGKAGESDGLRVASALAVADPSGLLSHWGPDLLQGAWSGVLDAIESSSGALDAQKQWVPQGLSADDQNVAVRFATGGAR